MIAVIGVGVVMYAAGPVVDDMGRNDKEHSEGQQPDLVIMPQLLGNQQYNAEAKYNGRGQAMVMFAIPMPKGVHPDREGDEDHEVFQRYIFNDVDTKDWQAR